MGALFSRPLTRQDLQSALEPIREDLKTQGEDLKTLREDLSILKNSLLAPDGDQVAKDVTVAVYSTGATNVYCHGCLMCRGEYIYLLSAAHAIVNLTYDGTYSMKWSAHRQSEEGLLTNIRFDRIHIPKEYVKNGSKDVGIARLKKSAPPNETSWSSVSVSDGELVGKTVVGHGRVFMRGSVLTYPNENRMMIDTPSLSGCSGCPLFDSNGELAAFVHGGVKHRGGRVLHSHNNGTEHVTGFLYADGIEGVSFRRVDSRFYGILQIAEDIPDTLASQPTDTDAYKNEAPRRLREVAPEAKTLEEAMRTISTNIWPENAAEDEDFIKADQQLQLLKSNKIVH